MRSSRKSAGPGVGLAAGIGFSGRCDRPVETWKESRRSRRGAGRRTPATHAGLATLSKAVSIQARAGEKHTEGPVPAVAKADKRAFPLDEEFKEFWQGAAE